MITLSKSDSVKANMNIILANSSNSSTSSASSSVISTMDCYSTCSASLSYPSGTSLDKYPSTSTFYASKALSLVSAATCHPLSLPSPMWVYIGFSSLKLRSGMRIPSLPPTTGSLTPPRPCDPSTPPWLLAPSSPLWQIIPLAPPGSLVTPAPPWSVVNHPLPQDSTPTWSSRTKSSPRSWEPAATGSSVSSRLRVCLGLHHWRHRRSLNPWFHLPGLQVFK